MPKVYTVKEVARDILKCNTNKIYELINAGLIPVVKLGRLKIREEAIQEFLTKYEGIDLDELLRQKKDETL